MNKLNNHGQTLVMFAILIPVILMLMALIIDIAYLSSKTTKLESTTKSIIKNLYDNKNDPNINEMVIKLYENNEIATKNLEVKIENENFKIKNKYEIESIFGKIIGIKKYEVKVSLKGYNDKEKLQIKKE